MQVERTDVHSFVINPLPDGSKVIIDSEHDRVLALNATAGAAWDACSGPTTLSEITGQMQSSLGSEITEEIAQESILQLQAQNLVHTSGLQPNRRQFMASLLGTVALPLVVSLTMTEQRGYADVARSGMSHPVRDGKVPIQHSPSRPITGPFRFE
jgi:hypothetical protein